MHDKNEIESLRKFVEEINEKLNQIKYFNNDNLEEINNKLQFYD